MARLPALRKRRVAPNHPAMSHTLPAYGEKRLPGINWYGMRTLYMKEVRRFLKVKTQTVLAPAVTALLYLIIFVVAMGRSGTLALGVPYTDFIVPGLIVMAMIQNSFANTVSTLTIGKVQGTIIDMLMPPLSAGEILTALIAGAVSRGFMVGAGVWIVVLLIPGVNAGIQHLWAVLYFGFMGSVMLGLLGVLGGLWAEKFDHSAAIQNFLIQPLTFLSGTFYTLDKLPAGWRDMSLANPFFHIIDGFRYGFISAADAPLLGGALLLLALNLLLWAVAFVLLKRGWKLRA
jgi:ABC-2 type transport system permease protein